MDTYFKDFETELGLVEEKLIKETPRSNRDC